MCYAIIRYECTFHVQLRLFPWPSHLSDSVFLLDNLKCWSHSFEDVDVTLSSSLLGENHGTAFTRSGVGCIKKEAIVAFSLWVQTLSGQFRLWLQIFLYVLKSWWSLRDTSLHKANRICRGYPSQLRIILYFFKKLVYRSSVQKIYPMWYPTVQ